MTETTQKANASIPRPLINDDNAFLYEGFRVHELRIQRCKACQYLRVPPGPVCPHCRSNDWDTVCASGKGYVHSYTVHYHPGIPPYDTPHAIVLVDLDEEVRFLASMPDVSPEQIKINMPVKIEFRELADGLTLPVFISTDDPN